MTLHPDILTDLVILYHAGEASQASRALLEEEAARNPRIAAALSAQSRPVAPLPADPAPDERKVLRKLRLRYQALSFAAVWVLALLMLAFFPRLLAPAMGGAAAGILINLFPFALLALFFAGAVGALYFFVRAGR